MHSKRRLETSLQNKRQATSKSSESFPMLPTQEDLEQVTTIRMESLLSMVHTILEPVMLAQQHHGLVMEVDTQEQKEDIHTVDLDMVTLDILDMDIQVLGDTQATPVDLAILQAIQASFLVTSKVQLMEEGTLLHLCDYMGLQLQQQEAEDEKCFPLNLIFTINLF